MYCFILGDLNHFFSLSYLNNCESYLIVLLSFIRNQVFVSIRFDSLRKWMEYSTGKTYTNILIINPIAGDQYLKPYVISVPEVTVSNRTKDDEFLILASDGLWDVISNEVACQVVRKYLFERQRKGIQNETVEQNHTTGAASLLAELAVARGSKDNISVIIVELRKPQ